MNYLPLLIVWTSIRHVALIESCTVHLKFGSYLLADLLSQCISSTLIVFLMVVSSLVFLDASKAFDRVIYFTLFAKLSNRGIPQICYSNVVLLV